MKKRALIAFVSAVASAPALADPVVGTWKTRADDRGNFGYVEILQCGDKICGKITRAFNSAGQPVESDTLGRQMIWDMQAKGEGLYDSGKIWAPDRDRTYNSRMVLEGDNLKVSGCVFGICRGQTWQRLK